MPETGSRSEIFLSTVGIFDLPYLFHNNTISSNSLVGLHIIEWSEVDFYGNNFISKNNIFGGLGEGIRLYHSSITLWFDCSLVIANNEADFGAGIYIDKILRLTISHTFLT